MRSLVACALALALARCGEGIDAPPGERFAFRESLTSEVVQLRITNPTGLAQADSLLQSGATRWVNGRLGRGDGGFNAPWPWHLDPATVTFAEFTIEACQTEARAIADSIDYWIAFGQVCISGVVEAREP